VTDDQTINSYDLASGALVGSMPIDFPAMKIEVARTADLLKVSRYPSRERPAAINACNWSFACPTDVQARDLVALGTAVTGWRWDPEDLIMRPGESFTPETENLLDRMSAARKAGRLHIPKPDDGGNKLGFASVEFLATSNQLVLLGDRPKGHIFSPVVRAYEGVKLLMNERSSRKETATLAARDMPPPGDVEVAGEALVYAMLHAALEDRGKAESYLARTKELGGMEKFPDPIRAIEAGLKEP